MSTFGSQYSLLALCSDLMLYELHQEELQVRDKENQMLVGELRRVEDLARQKELFAFDTQKQLLAKQRCMLQCLGSRS